jgi:hypothetical protein
MNLQPINPPTPAFFVNCYGCGQRAPSDEIMADLDGACCNSVICTGKVQS